MKDELEINVKLFCPSVVNFSLFLLLFAAAFDGPFRYYAVAHGISWTVYIPKAFSVVVCSLIILHGLVHGQITGKGIWITLYILLTLSMGYLFATNVKQIAFGGFIFVPLLFGLIASKHIHSLWGKAYIVIWLIFAMAVIGVFLDYFIDMPWSGYMYEVGSHKLTAAKRWYSFGYERVCGFTRTSTSAAAILILTGFYLIIRSKRLPEKLIIWGLTGGSILLTTSKGLILSYLIVSVFLACHKLLGKPLFVMGCLFLMLVACLMPISTFLFDYSFKKGVTGNDVLYTLKSRLMHSWPEMFYQIGESGSSWFGKGLGGVGISQQAYDPNHWGPIDNLFVHLYALFGVFSVLVFLLWLRAAKNINYKIYAWDRYIACVMLIVLSHGITSNILQSAYLGLTFGLVTAYSLERKRFTSSEERQISSV